MELISQVSVVGSNKFAIEMANIDAHQIKNLFLFMMVIVISVNIGFLGGSTLQKTV